MAKSSDQIYLMSYSSELPMRQTSSSLRRTICGSFDKEFNKKFLGKRSFSIVAEKRRILKIVPISDIAQNKLSSDLNPKIRELEKLAKSAKKIKVDRKEKYNVIDHVSDLELYMAKKLMMKESAFKLQAHIQSISQKQIAVRKQEQFLRMTSNQGNSDKEVSKRKDSMASEDGPKRSIISDRDLIAKFNKFIVRKASPQKVSIKEMLNIQKEEAEMIQINPKSIEKNKQAITIIAKNMIRQLNVNTPESDINQRVKQKQKLTSQEEKSSSDGSSAINIKMGLASMQQSQPKRYSERAVECHDNNQLFILILALMGRALQTIC